MKKLVILSLLLASVTGNHIFAQQKYTIQEPYRHNMKANAFIYTKTHVTRAR